MHIISSRTLRNDYATVADTIRESGDIYFVTRNGAEDLVVMSHDTYLQREEEHDHVVKVLEAEIAKLNGAPSYTLEEAKQLFASRERQRSTQ